MKRSLSRGEFIRLDVVSAGSAIDGDGMELVVQRPTGLREMCIGCGICEQHCPLQGEAAIRVYEA